MNGEKKEAIRQHGINISLAAVATWLSLIPGFWFVVKPILVTSVSVAIAQDISTQVKSEVRPLNSAFKVILKHQIDRLRIDISVLQSRQQAARTTPDISWTNDDARLLEEKKIELDDLHSAYGEL